MDEKMKLNELRKKIDSIDNEICKLYESRMDVVSNILKEKQKNDTKILNKDRENEVLARVANYVEPKNQNRIKQLFKTIMRQSRETQYEGLSSDAIVEQIIGATPLTSLAPKKVAFAGLVGSYSHLAAKKMYPDAKHEGFQRFSEVLGSLKSGEYDACVLPIDNTTEGIVADVYDGMLDNGLYISENIVLPISHCLLGIKGSDINEIRIVRSHPQALGQCSEYIDKMKYDTIPEPNTSVAAKRIVHDNNPVEAAIASEFAAEIYGLEILKRGINNVKDNKTRFISVTRQPLIKANADRISISFIVPHESGFLANILSAVSDYDINILNIHSVPIPEKPWEYRFYMDINGNINENKIKAILTMFKMELSEIKFLGNYEDHL
jgi:chorismate mutase/prephenate dehydratase